jgi:two-component sensor histidine kinase
VLNLEEAVPLSLIVNELLTNCAKYGKSPDGISRVTLTMSSEAGTASLCVRDRGPGFPEPREQDNPTNLGLLLVRTLSEQIGGEASFLSRDGAIVQVSFPLQRV